MTETDPIPPEIEPPSPIPPPPRRKLVVNPNRVAVYMTSAAALLTGLAPVVGDLDLTSTAGIVAGLTAVVVVVNRWLQGWQQMEAADYQAQLLTRNHIAQLEQREAAKQVGRPGSRASRLDLPR